MNKADRIEAAISRARSGWTTHDLARFKDCTPSYVRKVCMRLFKEGKAAYAIEPHQGRSGFKRVWTNAEYARGYNGVSGEQKYTLPEYIQETFNYKLWHEQELWGREDF